MKKLIIILILVLASVTSFGQKIKQGNTIGVHALTFELNPEYTMAEAEDYLVNKYIPLFEKHHPGIKSYFTKSIRGTNKGSFGWINVVESLETLRKYYDDDGRATELERSIREKMKPEVDKINEIFKNRNNVYNTWLIL